MKRHMITPITAICLLTAGCTNSGQSAPDITETRRETSANMETATTTASSEPVPEETSSVSEPDSSVMDSSVRDSSDQAGSVLDSSDTEPIAPEDTKIFTEEDRWVYLDREDSVVKDDDIEEDPSKFVHYKVGNSEVKYYLEYIDENSFYITLDNSDNAYGRYIKLFIYDVTMPSDELWSLYIANYYVEPGEVATKNYHIDGKMKEKYPLQFGIAIDDRGFNYSDGKADVFKKTGAFNLDMTYYGIDNTIEYYDIDGEPKTEKLPENFNNIKLELD